MTDVCQAKTWDVGKAGAKGDGKAPDGQLDLPVVMFPTAGQRAHEGDQHHGEDDSCASRQAVARG